MNTIHDGEILEVRGHKIRVEIKRDTDTGAPWKEHDGHGAVREVNRRYGTQKEQKRAGDLLLGEYHLYSVPESLAIAKRDGWGLGDEDREAFALKLGRAPTAKEITAEAVRRDYEHLQAWCNDEWSWHGYIVTLMTEDDDGELQETDQSDSCWGFEYHYDDKKNQYFFDTIRGAAESLAIQAEKEAAERQHWNERDVITKGA